MRRSGDHSPHRAVTTCLAVGLLLLGAGCSDSDARSAPPVGVASQPRPQYAALVDAVVARGGRVWIETDLLKAWLEGPERYDSVLSRVLSLADRAGVEGIKIADELGYRDGASPEEVRDFLARTTSAIHESLPGQKVLVDFIVPELGCLPWWEGQTPSYASRAACAETARSKDPAATLAAVDGYIQAGGLDAIDLSPGLLSPSRYTAWGTSRDAAMAMAWSEADRRWGGKVRLQARKALAQADGYAGTQATAAADVATFVDVPLAHGAKSVDIWTWRQPYKGGSYMLMDPGLVPNALVEELRKRRARGADLWTHMTPSSLHVGLEADVEAATALFSTIFVASGTG
jgi:hypothetical protein